VATRIEAIDREIDTRVEALGYEVVELEWGGSDARPILRLRVDRPGSTPGDGVTVQDCAQVSRALEAWLDELPTLPERYVIEVSSPGVERPLLRRRDFERFRGSEIRVKAARAVEEAGGSRFQAWLDGVEEDAAAGSGPEEAYTLLLRLAGGEVLRMPRSAVVKANLVYRWDGEGGEEDT
jgi:ribosome maturation factor RimP